MADRTDPERPRRRVALLATCLVDQLAPEVGVAVVRVLRRQGVEVEFPRAQTCCGQAAWNGGYSDEARALAERTIELFEPYEAVVVPSGSCAGMLHHGYAELFRDDAAWLARARGLAGKTFEFSQYLVGVLGVVDLGARREGKCAYHPSCHARRVLGLRDEPELLLAEVEGRHASGPVDPTQLSPLGQGLDTPPGGVVGRLHVRVDLLHEVPARVDA